MWLRNSRSRSLILCAVLSQMSIEEAARNVRDILSHRPNGEMLLSELGALIRMQFLRGSSWKTRYARSQLGTLKEFIESRPHEFRLEMISANTHKVHMSAPP